MASGAFQTSVEVNEENNTIKFIDKKFDIDPSEKYIFLDRKGEIYNWSGNVLDPNEIYNIKVGGCVRICVGFQEEELENLYFIITETNVDGDRDKFKGKGYDVYGPTHTEFIDNKYTFFSKNIIEIWWTETWEKSNPRAAAREDAEKTFAYYDCNVCEEEISKVRWNCTECENYDTCENCKNKHTHKMDKFDVISWDEHYASVLLSRGLKLD